MCLAVVVGIMLCHLEQPLGGVILVVVIALVEGKEASTSGSGTHSSYNSFHARPQRTTVVTTTKHHEAKDS